MRSRFNPCQNRHRLSAQIKMQNAMPPTAPPRIIRRRSSDGTPARFEAQRSPEAPANPVDRLSAARKRRRVRSWGTLVRLVKP